jgi:hypothetical protein
MPPLIGNKEHIETLQSRSDATRAFLKDMIELELSKFERGVWLAKVREATEEPLPVAPVRGLIARVADVFV